MRKPLGISRQHFGHILSPAKKTQLLTFTLGSSFFKKMKLQKCKACFSALCLLGIIANDSHHCWTKQARPLKRLESEPLHSDRAWRNCQPEIRPRGRGTPCISGSGCKSNPQVSLLWFSPIKDNAERYTAWVS